MYHLEETELDIEFQTEPFDSTVWEVGTMAGRIDLGGKLKEVMEQRDWEGIKDIFENITHQMTFYTSTYMVLPHMVKLLEAVMEEADLEHIPLLIVNLGICLATDIPGNRFEEVVESSLLDNYNAAARKLAGLTKRFINTNLEEIQEMEEEDRTMLLIGTLAILGERKLVFAALEALGSGEVAELHLMCGGECEFFEECVDPYEEDSEIGTIVPAQYEPETWDGISYNNAFLWTSAIADMFDAEEQIEVLRWFYGTFTCPECGKTKQVLDYMITYLTEA